MTALRYLLPLFIVFVLLFSACSGNQENKLIGVWTITRMDALPSEYPIEQWEFTSDNDLLKRRVTEVSDSLISAGRWGITKKNRLNISKFDVGFNGEWEVVTLTDDVFRIVLKVFVEDENGGGERPAGQILVEASKYR
jgi:hypothetical protein